VADFFEWNSGSDVVIYGAAALGTLVYRNIQQRCRVIAFFDKRGDELDACMGIPVHTPEQAPFSVEERKKLTVVLAIKNIFEHEQLVNRLVDLGYERIIFKAADQSVFDKRGIEGLVEIGSIFEQTVAGTLTLPENVPLFRGRFRVEWRDHAVIRQTAERVVVHVPVLDIATNKYGDSSYAWEDVAVAAMFPHLEFFEYLAGDANGNPDFYVEDFIVYTAQRNGQYATTERWKENVIQNRTMVHEQMNLAWELDREFFVRNAPEAAWNPRGHFNLTSGKHRATFLVSKGCKFIALSMSADDYAQYLNQPALEQLMNAAQDHGGRPLPTPVLHPFFYRYPSACSEAFYGLLSRLVRVLGKQAYLRHGIVDFKQLHIVDRSRDWAGLSLRLAKLGAYVTRPTGWSEWERLQGALYRIALDVIESNAPPNRPDLTILDNIDTLSKLPGSQFYLFILDELQLEHLDFPEQNVLMSFFRDGKKQVVVLASGAA
jgi:hypothetical protein